MAITCGKCKEKHLTVDAVRACHTRDTFACHWLIERPAGWHVEAEDFVEASIIECGALAWEHERGWTCETGHEHIYAEVRSREGWEYAEDENEARGLAKAGVFPVDMQGRAFI
jgi:hypothetical protein